MCARDPLFFVNMFGVIFEPRNSRILPMVLYPIQNQTLLKLNDNLGVKDTGIDKSRDMGGSWVILTLLVWRWLFRPMQRFMVVSRGEDLVDRASDSDSLFWKIDFIVGHLPYWLRPKLMRRGRERQHMHFANSDNGSAIDGAATTGNIGRGGRRLAFFMDEAAAFSLDDGYKALGSTQSNTDCRLWLSTPQGAQGAFYDIMHDPDLEIDRIHLHWSMHPFKRPGLYTSHNGTLDILDDTYPFPVDYPFILDGKLRSPWYDYECKRCPVPMLIAQELDIDYLGSSYQAFNKDVIQNVVARDCRPALLIGELEHHAESGDPVGFQEQPHGRLKLWSHLDPHGRLSTERRYAIGCDIAMGTIGVGGRGASNSVATILDRDSGVQVGQLCVNAMDPKDFAKYCVALAKWCQSNDSSPGAYLGWEANGPGRQFCDEVIRLSYGHIYFKKRTEQISKKRTEIPGWHSTKDTKKSVLSEFQRAVGIGDCTIRDVDTMRECESYVVMPDGSWKHVKSVDSMSPFEGGDNHGDRVISAAVAWEMISEAVMKYEKEQAEELPLSCMARRQQEAEKRRLEEAFW